MRDVLADIYDLVLRSEIESGIGGGSREEIERFIEQFDSTASEEVKAKLRRVAFDLSQLIPSQQCAGRPHED